MLKIKELKSNRILLYQECREVRKKLKALIEDAKALNDKHREEILDQIETLNQQLSESTAKITVITDEIDSRRVKKKPKNKKAGKVHNIAGRHIDPTGFSGVVQGGAPGGGKRK